MALAGQRPDLFPLAAREIATSDPDQRDQIGDLVFVQVGDRFLKLGSRRVVLVILQDLASTRVGRIRTGSGSTGSTFASYSRAFMMM